MDSNEPQPPSAFTRFACVAGPLSFLLILSTGWTESPWAFPGLTPDQRRLIAIFAWVIAWWIGEVLALELTGLLGCSLAAVLGVGSVSTVLAGYVHPLIFLFLGAFLLARAMQKQGLDRALARAILGHSVISSSTFRMYLALGLIAGVFSAFVSNTATVAMAAPIVLGMSAGDRGGGDAPEPGNRFEIGALLLIAFASTLGGLMTPVGTPPNGIILATLRDDLGLHISFLRWVGLTAPIALTLGVGVLCLLWWLYGRDGVPPGAVDDDANPAPKGVQRNRWIVFGVFALTVSGWLAPDIAGWLGQGDVLKDLLPLAVPPLVAACILFVIRGEKPGDVSKKSGLLESTDLKKISWGTLLLFGGGLALGGLATETGLTVQIGQAVAGLGIDSIFALTAVGTALAILMSEASSNTASASIVVPMVIGFSQSAGVSPVIPALGAALGASFGFMMPVSTPPNAIIYGTGAVPLRHMMRAGILLDVAAWAVIVGGLHLASGWLM